MGAPSSPPAAGDAATTPPARSAPIAALRANGATTPFTAGGLAVSGSPKLTPCSSIGIGSRPSRGLSMMNSGIDESKLRHVSSKDELEAAFRKREVAVAALKAKMSQVRARALLYR